MITGTFTVETFWMIIGFGGRYKKRESIYIGGRTQLGNGINHNHIMDCLSVSTQTTPEVSFIQHTLIELIISNNHVQNSGGDTNMPANLLKISLQLSFAPERILDGTETCKP